MYHRLHHELKNDYTSVDNVVLLVLNQSIRKTRSVNRNENKRKLTSERETITRMRVESRVPIPLIALCKRSAKNDGRSRIHVINAI